ncbi:hypothetical protein BpHYR1_014741 [Brachionus plicatilis]|uniref:Retrotransposon gag domain-containing protein n=1 Tax=Brachionus plicatilis TaxID=10195 RepID=A0A3M7S3M4_BRAPC|nr:hypothetical protein BpHYR1_014741 [Brachionus plicatilis]
MITPKKDNYFDNETFLYQFRRLFTLFKYSEVLKASNFEIDLLVDNATTHTKVEIDVSLFAKGVNHSSPVEYLLWTVENGIERIHNKFNHHYYQYRIQCNSRVFLYFDSSNPTVPSKPVTTGSDDGFKYIKYSGQGEIIALKSFERKVDIYIGRIHIDEENKSVKTFIDSIVKTYSFDQSKTVHNQFKSLKFSISVFDLDKIKDNKNWPKECPFWYQYKKPFDSWKVEELKGVLLAQARCLGARYLVSDNEQKEFKEREEEFRTMAKELNELKKLKLSVSQTDGINNNSQTGNHEKSQAANLGINEADLPMAVIPFLRGSALSTIKNMIMKNKNLKWDDIMAHFKSSNKLIQVESTTLTELINLKLDGSGCDEFLIRFQNLCDKLSRTHESDKVRLLIRAVPKRICEELMLRQIERLDEALNVVKVMHSCMGNTSCNTDKVNMARYVGINKSKASSNKFYHYAKNGGNSTQYYRKTDTGHKKKTYCKRDDIYKDKGHKGNYKKINVANAISASESLADEDYLPVVG